MLFSRNFLKYLAVEVVAGRSLMEGPREEHSCFVPEFPSSTSDASSSASS